MGGYELSRPLLHRVQAIRESLFYVSEHVSDGDVFVYGTRESLYRRFEIEELRHNRTPSPAKYLESYLRELDDILKGTINLENRSECKLHSLINLIYECKDIIGRELNVGDKVSSDAKHVLTYTYKWQGKSEEIEEFYGKLLGIFISENTTVEDFKTIFKSEPISNVKNPVHWKSSNATELLYFVMALRDSVEIPVKLTTLNRSKLTT